MGQQQFQFMRSLKHWDTSSKQIMNRQEDLFRNLEIAALSSDYLNTGHVLGILYNFVVPKKHKPNR
jgi:hypothetical protein